MFALTWPSVERLDVPGLDLSWQVAFQLAADRDVPFGSVLTYTYGPLGFLTTSAFVLAKTGALVLVARSIAWFAFSLTAVLLLRTRFGLLAASALAVAILSFLRIGSTLSWIYLMPLCAAWALSRLQRDDRRWPPVTAVVAALVGSLLVLAKIDGGLAVIGVGLLASVGGASLTDRRAAARNLAWFAGTIVVAIPVLWVVARQALGDLPTWLLRSVDVVSGYSGAMGVETPSSQWEYTAALGLAATLVGLLWLRTEIAVARRVLLTAVLLCGLYPAFRSGFTRHAGRGFIFFLAVVVVVLGFAQVWPRRQTLLVLLASLTAFGASTSMSFERLLDFDTRLDDLADSAHLMVSRGARATFIERQQTALRSQYQVPESMLARIGNRTVHIAPFETAVAYAYLGLRWHPLPVFQSYQAYTGGLDRQNARYLTGPSRPRFILNQPGIAIDGRVPRFDPPTTSLEVLCRYRTVERSERWQLLEIGRDRCGSVGRATRVTARLGERVVVPKPRGDIVVARFDGIGDSFGIRLETLLFRGPRFSVSADGETWNRLIPGTQHSWHVLNGPACARPELDGTGPTFDSIVVSSSQDATIHGDSYTIEFARIPYAC